MQSPPNSNPAAPLQQIQVATPSSGIIPGLEPLLPLNQVFVKQHIDVMEVISRWEEANRYAFFAPNGQIIYMGEEESDACARQSCKSARAFLLHVRDPNGLGILLDRPEVSCCLTSMQVFAISTGQFLGSIQQQNACFSAISFDVLDEMGNVVFIIKGPCCTEACYGDVTFELVSPTNIQTPIGMITKMWAGIGQEMYTNADNFGISFPGDLSVKMKAVLLGACILIDFTFYERSNNGHRGMGHSY